MVPKKAHKNDYQELISKSEPYYQIISTTFSQLKRKFDKNELVKTFSSILKSRLISLKDASILGIVLSDMCIFQNLKNGKTRLERCYSDVSLAPESDESIVKDALLDSFVSVFKVQEVIKGAGFIVSDIVYNTPKKLLLETSRNTGIIKGDFILFRVADFKDFYLGIGLFLIITNFHLFFIENTKIHFSEKWGNLNFNKLSREQKREISYRLILDGISKNPFEGLKEKLLEHLDLSGESLEQLLDDLFDYIKNAPCFCGSNLPFKDCCAISKRTPRKTTRKKP